MLSMHLPFHELAYNAPWPHYFLNQNIPLAVILVYILQLV